MKKEIKEKISMIFQLAEMNVNPESLSVPSQRILYEDEFCRIRFYLYPVNNKIEFGELIIESSKGFCILKKSPSDIHFSVLDKLFNKWFVDETNKFLMVLDQVILELIWMDNNIFKLYEKIQIIIQLLSKKQNKKYYSSDFQQIYQDEELKLTIFFHSIFFNSSIEKLMIYLSDSVYQFRKKEDFNENFNGGYYLSIQKICDELTEKEFARILDQIILREI